MATESWRDASHESGAGGGNRTLVTIPLDPELETYLIGLPYPDNEKAFAFPQSSEKGHGRTVRSLTFHNLRRSFNSAMANTGVFREIRMKLTGHASVEINKGYTHMELKPLRAAVTAILRIAGKKGPLSG